MYVVANRVPVAEGWREAFEERFRARAGQVDQQAGFVRMEVLRPDPEHGAGVYVVLTHWRDKQAFENWIGSPDFREAHKNPLPKEAFDGEGKLERHEAIIVCEAAQ